VKFLRRDYYFVDYGAAMKSPPTFERTPAYRLAKRTTPKRLAKDALVDHEWHCRWEWEFGGGKQRWEEAAERMRESFFELDKVLSEVMNQRRCELRLLDIRPDIKR